MRTEPYAYDRIEVLRGPSSIIAGANDPGGVVNLVSKRPRAQVAREVGVTFGNYNRQQFHADLTGPLTTDGSWLYRLVALGKDSNTQIEHADEQRALVAPSVTWRPNARHSVTLFGEYQYDRSKNTNAFLGLAGTLHTAPNGPIPTDLFIGEPDWDRYGGTRWRFGYAADVSLNDSWQLRHNLRHDRVDGLMESMYAAWWGGFLDEHGNADANGRYLGRQWYIYDDRSRVTATELLLQGRRQTGAVKHTLLLGVDGMVQDAAQDQASDAGVAWAIRRNLRDCVRQPGAIRAPDSARGHTAARHHGRRADDDEMADACRAGLLAYGTRITDGLVDDPWLNLSADRRRWPVVA